MTAREAMLAAFASFPERLRDAALAVAGRPIPPSEWGPTEVVRHLIAVEAEVHQSRLRQVAAVDDPQWQWTEPGLAAGFDGAPLPELLASF